MLLAIFGTMRGIMKLRRSALRFVMKRAGVLTREDAVYSSGGRVEIQQVRPSDLEEADGFALFPYAAENVVRSDEFDTALRRLDESGNDLPLVVDASGGARIWKHISAHKEIIGPLLTAQFRESLGAKQFHNDAKLCLADDLIGATSCKVHVGWYYDTFLTNDIGVLAIRDSESNRRVVEGGPLFPLCVDTKGVARLRRLGEYAASNHIGVATLGFTSDGRLIVWEQNWRAMFSNGKLVPTGSGSCDKNDLAATLMETVRNTMNRELSEESSKRGILLSRDAIYATKILGFFRHVRRGGKPEFIGITRLRVDAASLQPDQSEVTVPSDGIQRSWLARSAAETFRAIDEIHASGRSSVPLAAALDVLKRYMTSETESAETFLFSPVESADSEPTSGVRFK